MDTIAINANDANSQEGKKKGIDPNTIAAATTTAAAGIALGATISSLEEDITEDVPAEEVEAYQSPNDSDHIVEAIEDIVIVQVNPDEVMLEESSFEEISIPETVITPQLVEDEYQPFTNNDVIAEEVIEDDVPIADYPSEDVIADDSTEDVICGIEDNHTDDIFESESTTEENLLADIDTTSVDIQTDLMA